MAAHDALPAPLRLWLKAAVLPWSADSARRVWEREVRRSGVEGALRRLAEVEAATLAREAKSGAVLAPETTLTGRGGRRPTVAGV
jgi:hypothetical protein